MRRGLALFLEMSWVFSRMGILGAVLTPIHPLSGHEQSWKAVVLLSWLNQPTAGQSCGHCYRDSVCTSGVTGKAGIVWGMRRKYLVCVIQEAKEAFKYVSLQYHM